MKKFLQKLFRRTPAALPTQPSGANVLSGREHGIPKNQIPDYVIEITSTLQAAGFEAYVVGGAVRDLLAGKRPKDFDIATDATPQQIKKLFRRAILIGRRFPIVHVLLANQVIEVTTFRAPPKPPSSLGKTLNKWQGKKRVSDNNFGSRDEDAARRDFTVNALYYDPGKNTVINYFDGVADVRHKVLRMIGNPDSRYLEDPVRMLRVLRFAAKLGFTIDPATAAPIKQRSRLLAEVPKARLFMEIQKLLLSGNALLCLRHLHDHQVHHLLWQALGETIANPSAFLQSVLAATDLRVQNEQPVSFEFVFAGLYWQAFEERRQALMAKGAIANDAVHQAANELFSHDFKPFGMQRRIEVGVRNIWSLQTRLEKRSRQAALRLIEHEDFRAAYDFLLLRAVNGEADSSLGQWWRVFYEASPEERENLLQQVKEGGRRRSSPRSTAGSAATPSGEEGDGEPDSADNSDTSGEAALKPRPSRTRRRRARPAAPPTA